MYYRSHSVDSRLDSLTLGMLGKRHKGPRLHCKAAEARFLVPFLLIASEQWLSEDVPLEATIKACAKQLNACYDCLSHSAFSQASLASHARKYSQLAVALESASPSKLFHVRPKLHLLAELAEYSNCIPSSCWTYRDEDFGGTVAGNARRMVGTHNALSSSRPMYIFVCNHAVPRM